MHLNDLLVPRHPHPRLHAQHARALQQLPEAERALPTRCSCGSAMRRTPTTNCVDGQLSEADFQHWVAGLPTRVRQAMTTAGFAAAGSNWAFRRHVLERRDVGYAAFMQQLLSAEDWAFWQQQEDEAT